MRFFRCLQKLLGVPLRLGKLLRLGLPLVPLRLSQVFKKMLKPVLATRFILQDMFPTHCFDRFALHL